MLIAAFLSSPCFTKLHVPHSHVCIHTYMCEQVCMCISTCSYMCVWCYPVQGARMLYERESQIAIDYSRLEKKLKEVRTTLHNSYGVHFS